MSVPSEISADTYFGGTRTVSLDGLRHRVGAYAVIVRNGAMLLLELDNGKYYFPGGGVHVGESLTDAVRREAFEELGVVVEVRELLHADDSIFYHDPADHAAHIIRLFYQCETVGEEFSSLQAEESHMIRGIEWVGMTEARAEDFLPTDWRAFCALRERLNGK